MTSQLRHREQASGSARASTCAFIFSSTYSAEPFFYAISVSFHQLLLSQQTKDSANSQCCAQTASGWEYSARVQKPGCWLALIIISSHSFLSNITTGLILHWITHKLNKRLMHLLRERNLTEHFYIAPSSFSMTIKYPFFATCQYTQSSTNRTEPGTNVQISAKLLKVQVKNILTKHTGVPGCPTIDSTSLLRSTIGSTVGIVRVRGRTCPGSYPFFS